MQSPINACSSESDSPVPGARTRLAAFVVRTRLAAYPVSLLFLHSLPGEEKLPGPRTLLPVPLSLPRLFAATAEHPLRARSAGLGAAGTAQRVPLPAHPRTPLLAPCFKLGPSLPSHRQPGWAMQLLSSL